MMLLLITVLPLYTDAKLPARFCKLFYNTYLTFKSVKHNDKSTDKNNQRVKFPSTSRFR